MIDAIEENLKKGLQLLDSLTDAQYRDTTTPPYFSSIGSNVRHILDVFTCLFKGMEDTCIDFSYRERNTAFENDKNLGISYFNETILKLKTLQNTDFNLPITVIDDLGQGRVSVSNTLGGVLLQVHTHTLHHYASIGFIMYQLGIIPPDTTFGYNPTTPKKIML